MLGNTTDLANNLPQEDFVVFEQPLTERLRTFLRIELLYRQALFPSLAPTDLSTRAAVSSLLEIMIILGRGDTRAEVLNELEHQNDTLAGYQKQREVDLERLNELLSRIEKLRAKLTDAGTTFMNPLKHSDFLNAIKHRSAIPGGTCIFDLPDYGFWLRLPYEERANQFHAWTNTLAPVCDAVTEVLWLTRETTEPEKKTAEGGLYQHRFGQNKGKKLVRVFLADSARVYPEISAGKHNFAVRFVEWKGIDSPRVEISGDVIFLLALC